MLEGMKLGGREVVIATKKSEKEKSVVGGIKNRWLKEGNNKNE